MKRTRADLIRRASDYARDRGAPLPTIVKEVLHCEILHSLNESGATSDLTFQGGTALRLCYGGTRYSEDLDFVGLEGVHPDKMVRFADLLKTSMEDAYGLTVEVDDRSSEKDDVVVAVDRWRARIRIPDQNPANPQSQVINIEIAAVPSYAPQLMPVRSPYPHLPEPIRTQLLVVESPEEILADKIVAVSARPYLKARDLWDLKMLKDMGIAQNLDWVVQKFSDYHLDPEEQLERLGGRIEELERPAAITAFRKEMSRFVDARVAEQLRRDLIAGAILRDAAHVLDAAHQELQNRLGMSGPSPG